MSRLKIFMTHRCFVTIDLKQTQTHEAFKSCNSNVSWNINALTNPSSVYAESFRRNECEDSEVIPITNDSELIFFKLSFWQKSFAFAAIDFDQGF
ncbi:hypothetical protein D3C87_1743200 [compost metagenome]